MDTNKEIVSKIIKNIMPDINLSNEKINSTQAFFDNIIKEIKDGIIVTKDDRYIKILEIEPINFNLRNNQEQDDIILSFLNWVKIAPVNMQIKVISEKSDTQNYINNLKKIVKKEKNLECVELCKDYACLINNLGSKNSISRKFYIIYEYESSVSFNRNEDFFSIKKELERIKYQIDSYFAEIGNRVIVPRNENEELMKLLYNFINKKTSRKISMEDKTKRLYEDIKKLNPNVEETKINLSITDVLAPKSIVLNAKDYCIIDGEYRSYLYITADGYPEAVYGGWLSNIVTLGAGIDVDLFFHKENTSSFQKILNQRMKFTKFKAMNRNDEQSDYDTIVGSIRACQYIKAALNANENVHYMTTLITVHAQTLENLRWRVKEIVTYLDSKNIHVAKTNYMQEQAFISTLPLNYIDSTLFKRSKRNITSSGIASCYPFTAYELNNPEGVMLGINSHNASLCSLDPFNTSLYKNANIALLGTTGAGKTFTLLLLAIRLRILGTQCFILAPDKQHEFRRITSAIGGSFINISPSSQDCINIMEIRPSVSPTNELLDGETYTEKSWLSEKIQELKVFYNLLIPDLTLEEEQLLDVILVKTYNKKGITDDNDSLFIDSQNKELGLKEPPILGDLYEELCLNSEIPKRVKNITSQFITGSSKSFNQQTNVDLDNKFIVFGLEGLKNTTIMAAGMFIALQFVWSKVKEDRTKKKMVFIDEGWQLINGDNPKSAQFVQRIFKVIRGYGGGALFATQDVSDLYEKGADGKSYGNAILSCTKIKMVLQLEDKESNLIKDELNLSTKEIKEIRHYKRGQCLICANSNHLPINVIASQLEEELITTDRQIMEEILKRKGVKK